MREYQYNKYNKERFNKILLCRLNWLIILSNCIREYISALQESASIYIAYFKALNSHQANYYCTYAIHTTCARTNTYTSIYIFVECCEWINLSWFGKMIAHILHTYPIYYLPTYPLFVINPDLKHKYKYSWMHRIFFFYCIVNSYFFKYYFILFHDFVYFNLY